jgi:hypothetical protein
MGATEEMKLTKVSLVGVTVKRMDLPASPANVPAET